MIIRRLLASFGNLKNSELKLGGGLNIIEAPNESGKSTWCAFIRAMLYGINTSGRDRRDALSDKTRYRPWSGALMEGTMDVISEGQNITLRRTGPASSPMKRFSAVYTDTGDPAPFAAEDVGEKLTGAPERVFERTAFIRQSGLRVDQEYELEKRIASLVSSGDEQTSYGETEDKLRAWKNALRHNRTGSLPGLEAKRLEAVRRFAALEDGMDALSDTRREVKRLEALRDQLQEDIKSHDILDSRADAKRVLDARAQLKKAEEALNGVRAEAEPFSNATREAIDSVNAEAAALSALAPVYSRAKDEYARSEAIYTRALDVKNTYILSALSESEASELAERARALKAEAEAPAPDRPLAYDIIPTIIVILTCIAAFIIGTAVMFAVFGAVFLAAALFIVLSRPKRDTSAEDSLKAILDEYGFESADKLTAAVSEYSSSCRALENAGTALAAAKQSLNSAEEAAKEGEERLLATARSAFPGLSGIEDIPNLSKQALDVRERLEKAEADYASAKAFCDAVEESCDADPDEVDFSYVPVPMRSRDDTLAALARTDAQLKIARSELDRRSGELLAFGAPEIISGEIDAINAEIELQEEKYSALTLAADVLAEANTDMRTRFSPIINREAGNIMSRLTAGRYEKLTFDRTFSAEATNPGDAVAHSALALSEGTVDQLYLSLRLAMCDLILTGAEKCPIILDDVLANFDDVRAAEALRLLRELGSERQVLLFTCHTREAAMISGEPGVNVIKLSD